MTTKTAVAVVSLVKRMSTEGARIPAIETNVRTLLAVVPEPVLRLVAIDLGVQNVKSFVAVHDITIAALKKMT